MPTSSVDVPFVFNELTADYQGKRAEIAEKWKRIGTESTPIQVKAKRADIRVTHFGLAWLPRWR